MKRWPLLFLAALAACVSAAQAAAPARPNILFILSDDYGIDGVGCYGSDRFQGKTPNLDALAASGTRFTHCFSMPLCGPSRCTIMTGRYGFRTGGSTNQSAHQPSYQHEPSVAKVLKQAGYTTGMAGKWRQMGDTPGDWGYDEWLTDPTAGGYYWKSSYTQNGQLVETAQDVYCPDVCFKFAVDFFQRHREQPFYFYYPTHLIHGPILRTPDSQGEARADYYEDNVAYLDKQVGQLVAALERMGLREKTVILFVGDNGTARFGAEGMNIQGRRVNGMKGSLLEGGSRVPLLASWKGTLPAGGVAHDLIDFSDFFATFADLAGAGLPKDVTLDSRSFAPQLRGEKGAPREWVFVQLGTRWYVRDRDWKLTQSGDLFDMTDAPFEEKSVPAGASDQASQAARQRLQAVLAKLSPDTGKKPTDEPQPNAAAKKKLRKKNRAAKD